MGGGGGNCEWMNQTSNILTQQYIVLVGINQATEDQMKCLVGLMECIHFNSGLQQFDFNYNSARTLQYPYFRMCLIEHRSVRINYK